MAAPTQPTNPVINPGLPPVPVGGSQNEFEGQAILGPPPGTPWGPQDPGNRWGPLPELPAVGGGGGGGAGGLPAAPGLGAAPGLVPLPNAPTLNNLQGAPSLPGFAGGDQFGGQSTVNPQAGAADYNSVQQFADQAYDQNMRYLQPQLDQQNRALQQQMINQGVDPQSDRGRFMQDQLGRQQADAQNAASFNALQFGQGIQNQMFQQDATRSGLAAQMQQAQWQNSLGRGNTLANIYGTQAGFLGAQNNAMANIYGSGVQGAVGQGNTLANMYGTQAGFLSNIYGSQVQGAVGMGANQVASEANRVRAQIGNQNYNLGMGQLDLGRAGLDQAGFLAGQQLDLQTQALNEGGRQFDMNYLLNFLPGMGDPNNPNYGGQIFNPWDRILGTIQPGG